MIELKPIIITNTISGHRIFSLNRNNPLQNFINYFSIQVNYLFILILSFRIL